MPKVKSKKRYTRDLDNIKSMIARLERKIGRSSSSSSCESECTESDSSSESPPEVEQRETGGGNLPATTLNTAPTKGKDILELLGEHPSVPKNLGPDIHEELAVRWSIYLRDGISAETRKELLQKYLVPANCKTFNAPIINEEVKSIVPMQVQRNDHFFSNLQNQLGATLSSLSAVITQRLSEPDDPITLSNEIAEKLIDASQLVASVHHAISVKRKFEINPFMNAESRAASTSSAIDEFLFGSNFLSKVKERQEMKKAGAEIKKNINKPTPMGEPSNRNYLNSRRSYQKPKLKEGKRGTRFQEHPRKRESTQGKKNKQMESARHHTSYRKPYFK